MMRCLALVSFALTALLLLPPAHADDERDPSGVPPSKFAEAPDLFRAKLAQVDAILGHRGLKRGEVYEISRERMYAYLRTHAKHIKDPAEYVRRFGRGRVFSQNPRGGKAVPLGAKIDIVLIARNDGKVPPHPHFKDLEILALPNEARPDEPDRTPPAAPLKLREPKQVPKAQPEPKEAPKPAPDTPEAPPAPTSEAPESPRLEPTATAPDRKGPTPAGDAPIATGSPEAPREAGKVDPTKVPKLVGLALADAETLARQAGLELYVERVPGHPVGRILEQVPAGDTPKPQGNVVKVTVTAGGDYEAATPEAPDVYVTEVFVPDLLDRTKLQARRMLEDLGLVVEEEVAKRGLPGRVVDQRPAMGTKVKKGSVVVLRVGPGELPPPPTGPYRPKDPGTSTPDAAPRDPTPVAKGDTPRPIAPTKATTLPADATIAMGFMWSKVKGATAYLLEIEEQTATGWMASARKPVRTTAATLELERLDTKTTRAFRWRVRAVFDDRQGPPSDWIVLR